MARAGLDALESNLENQFGAHCAYRAEAVGGMRAHPSRDLAKLGIGQPGIGLGEWHERGTIAHGKSEIGVKRRAPPRSCLCIDHHRVDGQRVKLPFPHIAAPPPRVIGRGTTLEHQPLGTAIARLDPHRGQPRPIMRGNRRRQAQRHGFGQIAQQTRQKRPPRIEGARAQIIALPFEQIIGHDQRRRLGQEPLRHGFAPDAGLQLGKAQGAARCMIPCQDLAIDHRAIGQGRSDCRHFGEAVGHQLFAARPQVMVPAPLDQLAPDPIPFILGQPVVTIAQILGRKIKLMGQREGIGPRE